MRERRAPGRARPWGARRLLTPRWVAVHVGVLVAVGGFLALGWWQITRAAAGNLLSYGYAVEWPVFAVFVIWVWIIEMRKAVRSPTVRPDQPVRSEPVVRSDQPEPVRRRRPRNEAAYDDSDDPALAAYNHYLAWCNAHPHLTPADYPGMTEPPQTAKEMAQ